MSSTGREGNLIWELRTAGGDVLATNRDDHPMSIGMVPRRDLATQASIMRVYTTDGSALDVELYHRGDRGPVVRGVASFSSAIEILPEASNSVVIQNRRDPRFHAYPVDTHERRSVMSTVIHPGRAQSRRAAQLSRDATSAKTLRALEILKSAGQDGIGCSDFGAAMWGNETRSGRVAAVQGGGDYAAQMLLGRLRKRGLARVNDGNGGNGSSRWALTAKGALLLNPHESPWTQSARRALDVLRGR